MFLRSDPTKTNAPNDRATSFRKFMGFDLMTIFAGYRWSEYVTFRTSERFAFPSKMPSVYRVSL